MFVSFQRNLRKGERSARGHCVVESQQTGGVTLMVVLRSIALCLNLAQRDRALTGEPLRMWAWADFNTKCLIRCLRK